MQVPAEPPSPRPSSNGPDRQDRRLSPQAGPGAPSTLRDPDPARPRHPSFLLGRVFTECPLRARPHPRGWDVEGPGRWGSCPPAGLRVHCRRQAMDTQVHVVTNAVDREAGKQQP